MSRLWAIIQTHLDEYQVREAAFARRMGTSPQTLNSWKIRGLRKLPERWLLEAVARETRTPYRDVLAAVLADIGYGADGDGNAAPMTTEHDDVGRGTAQSFDEAPRPEASPVRGPDRRD